MAEQEQDRTEPATPHKLRESKKRGQVAKSLEFNSLFIVVGFLAVLTFSGSLMVQRQLVVSASIFNDAARLTFDVPHLLSWFQALIWQVFSLVLPLVVALVIVSIAANLLQIGPVFTFFPLKPDFERINPVAGLKRLFSMKLVFEGLKSLVKLALFGAVLYYTVVALVPKMIALTATDPVHYTALLLRDVEQVIFRLAVALTLVVAADFAYTRWDYSDKLKMSRREMREEVKRREGDPHVRARLRELQREAAKRGKALKRVPDADVLITNPDHFAIAIKYDRGAMAAPEVIAKGAGRLAEHMKMLARRHGVPLAENKKLARALFRETAIGTAIPESAYPAVARILAMVFRAKSQATRGASA